MRKAIRGSSSGFSGSWVKAVDLVGIHTARILFERAYLEVSFRFDEARLVRLGNRGANLSALRKLDDPRLAAEIEERFRSVFEKSLARLIGPEESRGLRQ